MNMPQQAQISEGQWEEYKSSLQMFMNNTENTQKIQYMINNDKRRFAIDLDKVRALNPGLANAIMKEPVQALKILKEALVTVVNEYQGANQDQNNKKINQKNVSDMENDYHITFEGNLGRNLITPRGLNSNMINHLVAVQGIVTRQSIVRQKLLRSVHYCEATQKGLVREYNNEYDLTSEINVNALNAFPLKDQNNNPLQTELGYCKYVDMQTILLQEMPERAPTGMIPRSVEIVLEDDLVDRVKPGDRVQAIGVYVARNDSKTILNGIFKCSLVCLNINVLATELEAPEITAEDIKHIKELSENKNILTILSQSIAPSIYGHDEIKFAILMMLLGGVEKVLDNGTHLRGDINIMLIGDPSTAKSQLLRRVLSIAPLAINTTGRGTSGVGLTAAVIFDKESGDRYLAAGAMVLADRGIVCIDEFDKMSEEDRVAIHEVMEQQTVTIAKAGIHTSLNARCSVIAAANPVYGEYMQDLPPTKNIGLPDSLLSRFDLLFIVLDHKNPDMDKYVAERVVKNHQYISNNQKDTNAGFFNQDDDFVIEPEYINEKKDHQVYEKFNSLLQNSDQKLVTQNFLKKYIFYAKRQFQPVLTEEATNYISNVWSDLRQKVLKDENNASNKKILPITIRSLETLIRIATAHAKLKMSKFVKKTDAMFAERLLNFSIYSDQIILEDIYETDTGQYFLLRKKNKPLSRSAKKNQEKISEPKAEPMQIEDFQVQQSKSGKKQYRRQFSYKSRNKNDQGSIKDEYASYDVDKLMDASQASQMPVSDLSQQQFVFKIITEIVKLHKKDVIKFDFLFDTIATSNPGASGYLNDKALLRRVLLDLSDKSKVIIDEADCIYPI